MLSTFLYHKGKPLETQVSRAQMLATLTEKECLLWVDMENPSEFESDSLVEIFNFHPLAVEDCITDLSQPKVDDYEEYLFLVVHAVRLSAEKKLTTTELDIFLGKNYVVTFHKDPLKSIEQAREYIPKKADGVMGRGSDMLVHFILDHLVDNYLPVLEHYDEKLDTLEEDIFNHPSQDFLSTLMQFKRDVFHLRRIIAPQRDTVNFITRNPTAFIKASHMIYFRDVYDHLFRVYGTIEGFHEILTGILQVYFSHSSHKLNEVVKHMTVMATLTMPLLVIASVYGMNFEHMPELHWKFGYLFSLLLSLLFSLVMLLWMKWKKWV